MRLSEIVLAPIIACCAITSISPSSAQEPELLASGIEMPTTEGTDIAINDEHVYFSSVAASGPASGYLGRVPLDGGPIEEVADGVGLFDFGANRPSNKILLTPSAIVIGYGGYDNYAIERMDYGGSNREVLVRPTGGYLLSSVGNDVFFGRSFNSIWRVNMNAPSDTNQVTTGRYWVRNDAQDGDDTFFNEYFTRSVYRIDPSSETVPELILQRAGNAPEGVVRTNQNFVFFGPRGFLFKIPKSGGSPTQIQLPDPTALLRAADDEFVYYTIGSNELWRMLIDDQTATSLVSDADFSGLGAFEESGGYLYYTQREPTDATILNLYRIRVSGEAEDPFAVAPPLEPGFFVTQDFACYECNRTPNQQYHAGLDIDIGEPSSDPVVSAAQAGELYALYVTDSSDNQWCEQTDSGLVYSRERWGELGPVETGNAGFGNTIILRHPDPDATEGFLYTQYSHLRCIDKEIAFSYLDQRNAQSDLTHTSLGQTLGILGRSGSTSLSVYGTHLHFEVKKFGTLAQSGFGYTERPPTFADYLDPFVFLHRDEVVLGPYTKLVASETDVAEILPGPGYPYVNNDSFFTNPAFLPRSAQAVIRRLVMRPEAETGEAGLWAQIDVAVETDTCKPPESCGGMNEPEGWVKIGNADGAFDAKFPTQITGQTTTIMPDECEAILMGGNFEPSSVFETQKQNKGKQINVLVLPCQNFDLVETSSKKQKKNKCSFWEKIGLGREISGKPNGNSSARSYSEGFVCTDPS